MAYVLPSLGAAIAVAGLDKLGGDRGYARMFRHLGWSADTMRLLAVAETVGGLLMMPRGTRRLGGALVAAVSVAVLASEIHQADGRLAGPRALVLLAGLAGLLTRGRARA